MKERWEMPKIVWDKAENESLSFILTAGQEYFNSVNKVSFNITSRSYTLLAIIISFISIFASLVFSEKLSFHCYPLYYYIWIFPIFAAFIFFLINIFPHKIMPAGYLPKSINYQAFFNLKDHNLTMNALIMDQIENVQQKIEFTEKSNKKRLRLLISGIVLTFISVLYFIVIILI